MPDASMSCSIVLSRARTSSSAPRLATRIRRSLVSRAISSTATVSYLPGLIDVVGRRLLLRDSVSLLPPATGNLLPALGGVGRRLVDACRQGLPPTAGDDWSGLRSEVLHQRRLIIIIPHLHLIIIVLFRVTT